MAARVSVIVGEDGLARCSWGANDPEYRSYHDDEWGVELHGDRSLFEKLSLEGFQAGLSWITILRRRDAFRAAFHGFDIERVAAMTDADADALLQNADIIRNRAKIEATLSNARLARELIRNSPGALDDLLWSFAPPAGSRPRAVGHGSIPAVTAESTAMSKALRALGYRFVGPTTLYALMQSSGMVDDHLAGCWRAASRP
ncbi:MAG: DNA-3-methyladenine glycosylase I [Lacisediminihabitans sp.]